MTKARDDIRGLDEGERVVIVGEHPWKGEVGSLVAYEPYGPSMMGWMGWRVALDNGTECYADRSKLRPLQR